jgi:hypothetical protein
MRCKSIKASYDLAKQGLSTIRRLEAATGFFIMGYERRYGRWTRTFRAEPDNEGDKGPRLFTWKELLNDYYGGFTNISGVPISNLNNNSTVLLSLLGVTTFLTLRHFLLTWLAKSSE